MNLDDLRRLSLHDVGNWPMLREAKGLRPRPGARALSGYTQPVDLKKA